MHRVSREASAGTAELLPDADADGGRVLVVAGVAQSYVDVDDPTHLEFPYVRLLGDVVDLLPAGPVTALHLGGGGCTLPRYVAATRPGSRQLVAELDPVIAALVREELGTPGFRLKVGDARAVAAAAEPGIADLVVADVFAGGQLPRHVTTVEWLDVVRRALRPGGTYAANVGDGRGLAFTRAQVATLQARFAHVGLLAESGVLRGRRFGNVVLVASDAPLPAAELSRRAASRAQAPARLLEGDELARFRGSAVAVTDATATSGPVPPPDVFVR